MQDQKSQEQISDKQLVRRLKAGDQTAFEDLIRRYGEKAFSLASRLTRNTEDAEEVLQDVFVTVFRKIKGFEGKSSFSSWLYRVTVNAAFMKLRKRKQDHSTPIEDIPIPVRDAISWRRGEIEEADAMAMRRQVGSILEDAISRLPEDYRPVFILRDIDGLTSREVSKILNLSVPAVKSRLHRSRLILRKRLKGFFKEYNSGQCESARFMANDI